LSEVTWILKDRLTKLRETKGTIDMLDSITHYNAELERRKYMVSFYYKLISYLPGINMKAAQILAKKFSTFKLTH
jgi:hypothetical protein